MNSTIRLDSKSIMLRQNENRKVLDAEEIALIVLMTILSICGIFFNSIVLIVYRKKRSQNAYMYLLFYLAIVDFSVSLLVIPLSLLNYISIFAEYVLVICQLVFLTRYSAPSLSTCILALIAIERYQTITSRTYSSIKNVQLTFIKNSRIALIIATFICITYGIGCFFVYSNKEKGCGGNEVSFNLKIYNYTGMAVLLMIMLVIAILYARIYRLVKKSRNKIFAANFKPRNNTISINKGFLSINHQNTDLSQGVNDLNEESKINSSSATKKKVFFQNNLQDVESIEIPTQVAKTLIHGIFTTSNNETFSLNNQEKGSTIGQNAQNTISTQDTLSSRLAKFYSKMFVTKPKTNETTNTLKITVFPNEDVTIDNSQKLNSASRNSILKINNNLSISKDWKVARIFAIVCVFYF